MAQRVQIILEDDFEGGDADETLIFGLDGAEYEIDLSSKNASTLREAMAPWIGHARRTGGRRRRASASARSNGNASASSSTSDIRSWAVAEGYEVSSRGRVSAEIREAYERAHG